MKIEIYLKIKINLKLIYCLNLIKILILKISKEINNKINEYKS
jgi:hypothetical protein